MTHNWKIYDLKRTITDGVVTNVTYACESEFSGSSTRKIGDLTLTGSADSPGFVAYENLTQADALAWIDVHVNKSEFETENSSSISSSIAYQSTITSSNGTPW